VDYGIYFLRRKIRRLVMPTKNVENLDRLPELLSSISKIINDLTEAFSVILGEINNRLKDIEAKHLELEVHVKKEDSNLKDNLKKLKEEQENLNNKMEKGAASFQASIRNLTDAQTSIQSNLNSLEISIQQMDRKYEDINRLMEKRLMEIVENISNVVHPVEIWNKEMSVIKAEVARLSREIEKKIIR
jgi:predicted  nucleic acid-binding Zn-ribbon protein